MERNPQSSPKTKRRRARIRPGSRAAPRRGYLLLLGARFPCAGSFRRRPRARRVPTRHAHRVPPRTPGGPTSPMKWGQPSPPPHFAGAFLSASGFSQARLETFSCPIPRNPIPSLGRPKVRPAWTPSTDHPGPKLLPFCACKKMENRVPGPLGRPKVSRNKIDVVLEVAALKMVRDRVRSARFETWRGMG